MVLTPQNKVKYGELLMLLYCWGWAETGETAFGVIYFIPIAFRCGSLYEKTIYAVDVNTSFTPRGCAHSLPTRILGKRAYFTITCGCCAALPPSSCANGLFFKRFPCEHKRGVEHQKNWSVQLEWSGFTCRILMMYGYSVLCDHRTYSRKTY
jgi:hypothetical protein